MFIRRLYQGGRAWGFCGGLGRDKGIDAIKKQGFIGEAGAGRTVFRVIELAVSKGAADGAETNNVFRGGLYIDDHGRG